mmetsp:Transcript_1955/g.4670  ORF Transcript_1955/g.4670 Transcript_1955/m.4670 type:complete len:135 (-) Transcript_1955:54-458(-)
MFSECTCCHLLICISHTNVGNVEHTMFRCEGGDVWRCVGCGAVAHQIFDENSEAVTNRWNAFMMPKHHVLCVGVGELRVSVMIADSKFENQCVGISRWFERQTCVRAPSSSQNSPQRTELVFCVERSISAVSKT